MEGSICAIVFILSIGGAPYYYKETSEAYIAAGPALMLTLNLILMENTNIMSYQIGNRQHPQTLLLLEEVWDYPVSQ